MDLLALQILRQVMTDIDIVIGFRSNDVGDHMDKDSMCMAIAE